MRRFFALCLLLGPQIRGRDNQVTGQRAQRTGSRRVVCGPFVLIGAMNPCPCGWYGDPVKECTCSNAMVSRYQSDPQASAASPGPLLDRIDIRIDVPRVEAGSASRTKSCRTNPWASRRTCSSRTGAIQRRVEAARERQRHRFEGNPGLRANADKRTCVEVQRRRKCAPARCASTASLTRPAGTCSALPCSNST
jgi:predicted ATPase with chaperone activity